MIKLIGTCLTAVLLTVLASCGPNADDTVDDTRITLISVPDLPALGPYSVASRAGGFVYLSGIVAYDAETEGFVSADIDIQTKQVFYNLDIVLAAAGLSKKDIVKTTVYLKNPKDFPRLNELYAEYFAGHKPARTTVPGVDWGRADVTIEIDVIALAR